jgi:hypothetical protein
MTNEQLTAKITFNQIDYSNNTDFQLICSFFTTDFLDVNKIELLTDVSEYLRDFYDFKNYYYDFRTEYNDDQVIKKVMIIKNKIK